MITEDQLRAWKANSTVDDHLHTYVLSDIRQMLGEIERLDRRVVALERLISEEMDAWETSDATNQLLIEEAHEAVKRRGTVTQDERGTP